MAEPYGDGVPSYWSQPWELKSLLEGWHELCAAQCFCVNPEGSPLAHLHFFFFEYACICAGMGACMYEHGCGGQRAISGFILKCLGVTLFFQYRLPTIWGSSMWHKLARLAGQGASGYGLYLPSSRILIMCHHT